MPCKHLAIHKTQILSVFHPLPRRLPDRLSRRLLRKTPAGPEPPGKFSRPSLRQIPSLLVLFATHGARVLSRLVLRTTRGGYTLSRGRLPCAQAKVLWSFENWKNKYRLPVLLGRSLAFRLKQHSFSTRAELRSVGLQRSIEPANSRLLSLPLSSSGTSSSPLSFGS